MSSFQFSFNTNCSLPQELTHIVSAPNVRGTLDILWGALSTLLLCTWSIQHLNVPAQRVANTFRQKFASFRDSILRKLFWMGVTLVAPEILVGVAFSDRISAHVSKRQMLPWTQDGLEWTLTHAFYANMGGFVVDFSQATVQSEAISSLSRFQGTNCVRPDDLGEDQTANKFPNGQQSTQAQHDPEVGRLLPRNQPNPIPSDTVVDTRETLKHEEQTLISPRLGNTGPSSPIRESQTSNQGPTGTSTVSQKRSYNAATRDVSNIEKSPKDEELKSLEAGGQKENNSLLLDLEPLELEEILQHKRSFKYGPFQIYPKTFILAGNYFNVIDAEKRMRSANEVIIGKAIRAATIQHFNSKDSFSNQKTKFSGDCFGLSRLQGSLWAVNARQLLLARKYGLVDRVPQVSEEELKDQSKGDVLVKGLAMGQSLYLTLQLIVRHQNHQPSSQLEIVVVAFAVCSFITYLLFLSKPQDVKTPRYIKARFYPTEDQMLAIGRVSGQRATRVSFEKKSYAIPNLAIHYNDNLGVRNEGIGGGQLASLISSILASVVFGLLHCAAWNLSFPTETEQLLWRVSSLIIVAIPPFCILLWVVIALFPVGSRRSTHKGNSERSLSFTSGTPRGFVLLFVFLISFVAYGFARIFLIVEMFRSLFFLPTETFVTTVWISSLPFIG